MRQFSFFFVLISLFLGACTPSAPQQSTACPPNELLLGGLPLTQWRPLTEPITLHNETGSFFEFAPEEGNLRITLMTGMSRGQTTTAALGSSLTIIPIVSNLSTNEMIHLHTSGPVAFALCNGTIFYTDEHISLSADIFEFFDPSNPDTWPDNWLRA